MNQWARHALVACVLTTLGAGCSSQAATRGPVDARAAGGLDARSASTLVPSDLALGRDVALAERTDRAQQANLDAYMKKQPTLLAAKRTPAKPQRKPPAPKPAAALPPPPVMALAPEATATTQTDETAPQLLAAANTLPGGDMERYAQREQRSRDLSGYRGGDAIVITSGALIVALLIVLLIVLLT
jgi:hypothetical protein